MLPLCVDGRGGMTLEQMKRLLRKNGLPTSGTKPELCSILVEMGFARRNIEAPIAVMPAVFDRPVCGNGVARKNELTLVEARQLCRANGLDINGSKEQLCHRLITNHIAIPRNAMALAAPPLDPMPAAAAHRARSPSRIRNRRIIAPAAAYSAIIDIAPVLDALAAEEARWIPPPPLPEEERRINQTSLRRRRINRIAAPFPVVYMPMNLNTIVTDNFVIYDDEMKVRDILAHPQEILFVNLEGSNKQYTLLQRQQIQYALTLSDVVLYECNEHIDEWRDYFKKAVRNRVVQPERAYINLTRFGFPNGAVPFGQLERLIHDPNTIFSVRPHMEGGRHKSIIYTTEQTFVGTDTVRDFELSGKAHCQTGQEITVYDIVIVRQPPGVLGARRKKSLKMKTRKSSSRR